jgi:hypothetical protein
MKKIILLLLAFNLAVIFNSYGQQSKAKLVELKDAKLVQLLASLDTVIKYNNRFLSMSIYKSANGYGSAHTPETDEVNYQILIAVSDGDDAPEQHLYKLGDFYNPGPISVNSLPGGLFLVSFEYGWGDKKQIFSGQVSLKKIVIAKRDKIK